MKYWIRNRQIGSVRRIVLVAAAAAGIVFLLVSVFWSDGKGLRRKHGNFLAAIEKRSPGRMKVVLSEHYSDRWDFTREDAMAALKDAGSQFLVLVIRADDPDFRIDGRDATVTVPLLRVGGKPLGPIGQEVVRRANRLDRPWVFTWRKEGITSSSWRLVRMENPALPDNLYGYEPGDIQRALRGDR